ncbi:uncharacterized protein N7500_002192 [Penicillium coprophilum]|uniref:uncharacterized protein n=1 Tax=Penicillium coprophilum TaxID=36646 RepID=UPI0023A58DE8|nr:uncharacterized protein N7500_002192 [Penicillium coprophilum]KAJ5169409.1 hypothetical protein N7500_002192 [Penicillium coprophilum]
MESTTEPTETTETAMNPNDSPLSNLDLWCDWSGSPEDPVSITIAMELQARDHPNLNLPVLNVQSPTVVKSPSWVIRLKPELTQYDDTPPGKETWQPGQEYGVESERYPANNPSISKSGSVVVHDGPRDDNPVSRHTAGILTQVDGSDISISSDPRKMQSQVNRFGGLNSPNPRKRTAKAASLPDSIPLTMITKDTSTSIVTSTPSPIRSLSPSLDKTSVTNENIPPQYSAPALVSSSQVTSERPSLDSKGVTVGLQDVPDEIPLCHNAEIPRKIDLSSTEPLTEANLRVQSYDTLSTRVCNGSLSDTENSDEESEDLLLCLESIRSSSLFSGRDKLPFPRTFVEIAKRPKLVLENDILCIQTSPGVYPATYQIAISLKVRLQKGKSKDWWELVVSGLPRLAQFESCYLYFRTPPGQGMEFMTSSFKRHTLVESCLMAQFDGGKSLVISFRKCNAQFYGPLKDHKVNAVIQAEVEEADPSSYLVKYNAVCAIDLINHNFWAEKCKFSLIVHGGPEGEFEANFEAQKPVINGIRLQPASEPTSDVYGIGLSRINIISTPQALDMFTVSWEVKLPREKALTWLPWIKTRHSDIETVLLEDYAACGPRHEYFSPMRQTGHTRCQSPCCLEAGLNHFQPSVEKTPHLHDGTGIHEPGVLNPFYKDPASYLQYEDLLGSELTGSLSRKTQAFKSTSIQTFVEEIPAPKSVNTEAPVARSEPKKPRRAVRGLWTLIKVIFNLCAFMASVHTLYWSHLLQNCGFRFDSVALHTSCPQNEVYVYTDYVENYTNADAEIEANEALEEFDLRPALRRPEFQHTPAEITPVPLRDRIDYLLGWRGPIARE